MSAARVAVVNPAELPPAVGYAHGVITAAGKALHVAGQIGAGPGGELARGDFAAQFAQALDNVLAVVRAAGAGPEAIARMTVYVTDMAGYRRCRDALGPIWRERLGRHYPAMALVAVTELVEPEALVEIEASAALPDEGG